MENIWVDAKDSTCNVVGKFLFHKNSPSKLTLHKFEAWLNKYEIVIPSEINSMFVTAIDNYAFLGGTGLTSITIPDSVTRIGGWAFSGCRGLTSITIPDSVTIIGKAAFLGCTGLTSISIGNFVTSIGSAAFSGCTSLESITIPNSVSYVGAEAFYKCLKLKTFKNKYFKATDAYMCCKDFKYELNKTFIEEEACLCKCGFHACKSPLDIFNYYSGEIGKNIRLFEVKLSNVPRQKRSDDSKRVGKKIKFIRELTISELARLASGEEE